MKRIVITTFGSYGDLHPYIAIARGLMARGHDVVLVTSEVYRSKVEVEGIAFHPMRPHLPDLGDQADVVERVYDPRRGAEYMMRELVMPHLAGTYDDLLTATAGADLIVSHPLTFAAPLVARKLALPWISTVLQPMLFMSTYEPPLLPPAPWLRSLHALSPALYRFVFGRIKRSMLSWSEPVRTLARRHGIAPPDGDPMFEGQYSPYGTLALFSATLAEPQPDWPAHTHITGFPFYDRLEPGRGVPPALLASPP